MKFLFAILLLASCQKKTIYTYPPAPADQASSENRQAIDSELEILEKEFAEIDVEIDLKKLPVVVAPLPFGVLGRCQYGKRNAGAYIVLSPNLFFEETEYVPGDSHLFEKEFVRVLLHEIGHCYFARQHEPAAFLESPGNAFELRYEGASVIFDRIPRSIMPAESTHRMPKSLRKYYLAEIARKARLSDPVMLEEFTEFRFVSTNSFPSPSDAVEAADEDRGHVAKFLECTGAEHAPEELGNFER